MASKVVVSDIATDLKLDNSDLVGLVVSAAEAKLEEQLKDTISKITLVEQDITDKTSARDKQLLKDAERLLKPAADHFLKGFAIITESNLTAIYGANKSHRPGQYTATLDIGKDKKNEHKLGVSLDDDMSEAAKKLEAQITADLAKLNDLRATGVDLRRKLADIPKLSRQAHAFLVTKQLETSDNGKELLAQIAAGEFTEKVLALTLKK